MTSPTDKGYSRIPLTGDECIYKMIITKGKDSSINTQSNIEFQSQQSEVSIFGNDNDDQVLESGRPLLESVCTVLIGRQNTGSLTDEFSDEYVSTVAKVPIQRKIDITIGSPASFFMVSVEKCLMTMQVGEVSSFVFYFDTEEYSLFCNEVDEKQPLYVVLVLYEVKMSKPFWALNPKEKYELALLHKERGKQLFSDNPELAFYEFSNALKYLITIPTYHSVVFSRSGISQEERDEYEKLQCVCHLNIAACQDKFNNYQGVIDSCTNALKLQPSNIKGLFRRCKAYHAKMKEEQARADLIMLTKLAPKNKEVRTLYHQINGER